jgi:hypothetical protein
MVIIKSTEKLKGQRIRKVHTDGEYIYYEYRWTLLDWEKYLWGGW